MLRIFFFSLLVAIIPTLINFKESIYAQNIIMANIYTTLIFLIAWACYGYYNGYKKINRFMYHNALYWGIHILLSVTHSVIMITILPLLTYIVSTSPMYALMYYFKKANIPPVLNGSLLIIIIFVCCSLGYFLGSFMRLRTRTKEIEVKVH